MSSNNVATQNYGCRTHVGKVRSNNEDSYAVNPPLYAVSDGMGGYSGGEIASEITIECLQKIARKMRDSQSINDGILAANNAILEAVMQNPSLKGMGCTITCALVRDNRIHIGQVGDSRAYLLHNNKLQQITRDHTYVQNLIDSGAITHEEAKTHPDRSKLTRALGTDSNVAVDIYELNTIGASRLLLCSDGLYAMVDDKDIERALLEIYDAQECVDSLVDLANKNGGCDNITAIVVEIDPLKKTKTKSRRKSKFYALLLLIVTCAIILIGGFATSQYTQSLAYLGTSDGNVAIYSGVPGDVLGLSNSQLLYVSEVKVEDLQGGMQSRLSEGVRASNLDEAYKILESYTNEIKKGI